MPRWARTLRLPVHHSALRVEATNAVLKARVRANPVIAAPFVRLAVVVPVALQLVAFLARFSLETFRAQADCAVVGNATESVDTARRAIGGAWVLALAVYTGQRRWAICVGAATDEAQSSVANVALQSSKKPLD